MTGYTDKQRQRIAQQEYNKYSIGDPITLGHGKKKQTIGHVSHVINDFTGQNAYVIIDKPVGTSANSVKHVTILYQGSNSTLDTFDDAANTFEDWLSNDIPAGVRTITPVQSAPTGQLEASSKTLQNIYAKYPQATFDVYGHSLGSMDAQYAVANLSESQRNRLAGGYFYEGPNVYHMLSKKERANVSELNKLHKTFNYVDENDIIPLGYRKDKKTVGMYIKILSQKVKDKKLMARIIDQHMWGGYQFDDNGNLYVDPSVASEYANVVTSKSLCTLAKIKSRFEHGGNSLTAGQKLFLDEYEAKSLVQGMQVIVDSEIGKLKQDYRNAIDDAKQLWIDAKTDTSFIGIDLTEYEQLSALDSSDVSQTTIETKPVSKYQTSISKLKAIEKEYADLADKIQHAIDHQIDTDHEMASQIKGLL